MGGFRGKRNKGRNNRGGYHGDGKGGRSSDFSWQWWQPITKEAKRLAECRLAQSYGDYRGPQGGLEAQTSMKQVKELADLLKRLNQELDLPRADINPSDIVHLIVNLCQAMPRCCGHEKLFRFVHHNFCRFVSVACVKQRMVWEPILLDVAIRNVFELVVSGLQVQQQENVIESLRTLSYLLAEKGEVGQDPEFQWSYLIQTLVSLASEGFIPHNLQGPVPDERGEAKADPVAAIPRSLRHDIVKAQERNINIRRFACICLGNLVAKSGDSLVIHKKEIFRAVIQVFSYLANTLKADSNKYPATMTTVLKSMCNVLGEWPSAHADYLPVLCNTMRTLMVYGTPLDNQLGLGARARNLGNRTDEETSTDDLGVTDSERGDNDTEKAAKLRIMVMSCLSCIARADAKLFHDHWLQFLPHNMNDAIKQKPFGGANMLTVAIHDPNHRVRTQALTTLGSFFEKNNLSNIAGKLDQNRKLAFDSMSTRYARILHALHHSLVYVLRNETVTGVKIQAIKSLNALVLNTTYKKLSPGLLKLVTACALMEAQGDLSGNVKYSLWALLNAVFTTVNQDDCAHKELVPFLSMEPPTRDFVDNILTPGGSGGASKTSGPDPLPLRGAPTPPDNSSSKARRPPQLKSLLFLLLADAKRRQKDEPYPDARSVVSKLARGYRFVLARSWEGRTGLKQFLLNGLRSEEPSVAAETLKAFEQGIIPVSDQALCSSRAEATYGLLVLPGAKEMLATELTRVFSRFPESDPRSTTLRARVLSVIAVLRVWHWQSFLKDHRKTFLSLAYNSTFDDSESVRTAACRALGVLLTFQLELTEYYELGCTRLIELLEDPNFGKQTQIRASWALANICDIHVNVHHQHPEEPSPDTIPDYTPERRPCLVELVSPDLVGRLIGTCFDITQKDQPKIIANAIRAVGNIGHWLPLDGPEEDGSSERVWVAICDVLGREMSIDQNRPHKAKWNACYATGNVLSNAHMPRIKTPEAKRYTLELYRTLLQVLAESTNFKVRINAVQALTAPPTRKHYGAIFGSLWVTLLNCIKNLQEKNSVKKYVEIKYQIVLTKKLSLAVFHMIDLCTPRDLKNVQVAKLLGQHVRVLARMLIERHRDARHHALKQKHEKYMELWAKECIPNTKKRKKNEQQVVSAESVVEAHKKVLTLLESLADTEEGAVHLDVFRRETDYFLELKRQEQRLDDRIEKAMREEEERQANLAAEKAQGFESQSKLKK